METRTVTQIKIWKLIMHAKNRNEFDLVAISADKNLINEWYNSQYCEQYTEHVDGLGEYTKNFKKGTPLEWYEPVYLETEVMDYEYGVSSEWVNDFELPILESFHTWLK